MKNYAVVLRIGGLVADRGENSNLNNTKFTRVASNLKNVWSSTAGLNWLTKIVVSIPKYPYLNIHLSDLFSSSTSNKQWQLDKVYATLAEKTAGTASGHLQQSASSTSQCHIFDNTSFLQQRQRSTAWENYQECSRAHALGSTHLAAFRGMIPSLVTGI